MFIYEQVFNKGGWVNHWFF